MFTINQLERHRSLKDVTTFGIGGAADYFIEVDTVPRMQLVLSFCHENHLPYFILGKGSNSLFDDRGFKGVVIANRLNFIKKIEETIWHVGAGYSFSLLGTQTARQGLAGLEFASGIPGSVGGAVYMNAGANGHETAETLLSVDFVTSQGELRSFTKDELEFGYRYSSFQNMPGAIVGAHFQLMHNQEARQKQLHIIQYRKETQPYGAKSAGCIFRNSTCGAAGQLIEQSGLKGTTIGDAQVSSLHANFIINAGNASSQDVLTLLKHVQQIVKQKTGVELESEVRYVPYNPEDKANQHE